MLRAEKRKFSEQEHQLQQIRSILFPIIIYRKRIDNFMPYYAKYGPAFIDMLYETVLDLETVKFYSRSENKSPINVRTGNSQIILQSLKDGYTNCLDLDQFITCTLNK
jgi:hypothetical protein